MNAGDDDPFRDPSSAPQPPQLSDDATGEADVPDTLAVGRNASLSLGTDSLIVLGAYLGRREKVLANVQQMKT